MVNGKIDNSVINSNVINSGKLDYDSLLGLVSEACSGLWSSLDGFYFRDETTAPEMNLTICSRDSNGMVCENIDKLK